MASTSALKAIVERMKERLVRENPDILKKTKSKKKPRIRKSKRKDGQWLN